MGDGEPNWRPISDLPMLAANLDQGRQLAREHLDTLKQAQPYQLDDATVARIIATWQITRDDLDQLFGEQGRVWQQQPLNASQAADVERYCAAADNDCALVDEILVLAAELQAVTIERLLAKSDLEVGLEALSLNFVGQQPEAK